MGTGPINRGAAAVASLYTVSSIAPGCYDIQFVVAPWNNCVIAGASLRRTRGLEGHAVDRVRFAERRLLACRGLRSRTSTSPGSGNRHQHLGHEERVTWQRCW